MTKRHRRTRDNRQAINREPMGYYLVIDHNVETSVLRYYNETEKNEILELSKKAQLDCTKEHKGKGGICCMLIPTSKETWEKWH